MCYAKNYSQNTLLIMDKSLVRIFLNPSYDKLIQIKINSWIKFMHL